jgi:hypothetical protein
MQASNPEDAQLPWEETYRAMTSEAEDWTDFDATLADELEDLQDAETR